MARSSTKTANEFKNLLDDAVKSLASKEAIDLLKILIRDDTHMTSMKIVQFSRPPHPRWHLRPKFFHPIDLRRLISNDPPALLLCK